jgi:hypothetical protein
MSQDSQIKVNLFCPQGQNGQAGILFGFSYTDAVDDLNRGPVISWQKVRASQVPAGAIVWRRGGGTGKLQEALAAGFPQEKFLVNRFLHGLIDLLVDRAKLGKKGQVNFWQEKK